MVMIGYQLSQLRRGLDVAPEKNEAARLHAPKHFRAGGVELFAGNAAEDELTERIIHIEVERVVPNALKDNARLRDLFNIVFGEADPPFS